MNGHLLVLAAEISAYIFNWIKVDVDKYRQIVTSRSWVKISAYIYQSKYVQMDIVPLDGSNENLYL